MVLNYVSLAILFMGLLLLFYGFLYLHELPHKIAKKRKHPQTEAIHVACWLSLFTLHAIWPIVFIWAMSNRQPLSVAVSGAAGTDSRLQNFEQRLTALESRISAKPASNTPPAEGNPS